MRSICYAVAMSLDGYIAGPRGENDWITMDPEIDFGALMSRFDTVLMGRRTFEVVQRAPGGGAMPGLKSVVVSRTLRPDDYPGITIISEHLRSAMVELRSVPGKDIWLFGGSTLARSLLELGQVDAVDVAVIPVLLGGGTPLVRPETSRQTLKLVGHRVYATTGIMSLEYSVVRS